MRRLLLTNLVATAAMLLFGSAVGGAASAAATDPSCAEGPARVGVTIQGTPCDDTIVAPPGVAVVNGGGGDDTIVPAQLAVSAPCLPGFPEGCHLGVGSQTFEGGAGDDTVYGERGNDSLFGGAGDDHLFGGIGDDLLSGGPGNDQLSGGFGADSITGEEGDDYIRGDGSVDKRLNGGDGRDTLSYSSGIAPGFTRTPPVSYPGFPSSGERGVYLDLTSGEADDGVAPNGGGVDFEIVSSSFEVVIGTPFSDYIVGTAANETIYGGGGADVIRGEGGNDTLVGGADGDDLDGGTGTGNVLQGGAGTDHCQSSSPASETSCESSSPGVVPRDLTKTSVGFTAPEEPGYSRLYLTASNTADEVTATYSSGAVVFELGAGSFDPSPSADGGCAVNAAATEATCTLSGPLDSVVISGMGENDILHAGNFPSSASVIVSGGEGNDTLSGGDRSEDVLADGSGNDTLEAFGGDDALLNNAGKDKLFGGVGNDLFLSNSICDGDTLSGEGDRDNASWAKFQSSGVEARLDEGRAGRPGAGDVLECSGGTPDTLQAIEDLEGSPDNGDVFYGDSGPNQLLGWEGADTYFSEGGNDTILANSGDDDKVIDCGDGVDTAVVDRHPAFDDPIPSGCETVREGDPNKFRAETELPPVTEENTEPTTKDKRPPRRDTKPPQTTIAAHPRKVSTTAKRRLRVTFRFASNEPGSFRCKLDSKPFTACRSPRAYMVRPGGHAVRIYAIDAAGNRDRTPALFKFRVRQR